MPRDNYYLTLTASSIKFSYVAHVPDLDMKQAERAEDGEKTSDNLRRAKQAVIGIGQCNPWEYLATFTSSAENPTAEIRALPKFIQNFNYRYKVKIRYLIIYELGEKGRRLHAHCLLSGVPDNFKREYRPDEYAKLPRDMKRLYSICKSEKGTRLCCCPKWKYGYSTLVPIDGSPRIISYLTKYMTKGNVSYTTAFGGHAYFASKGLKRPEKKKVPADIVSDVWQAIPSGAYYSKYEDNTGNIVSYTYIVDRDKIDASLWEYYSTIFREINTLQVKHALTDYTEILKGIAECKEIVLHARNLYQNIVK